MRHENIVKLYEVIHERGRIFLVMEYCEESLLEFLSKRGAMDEPRAYEIMRQIACGLNELVKLKIVHRDLKPANILYHDGIFKLADFGLVKYIENEEELLMSSIGTYAYMAPQILRRDPYTSKCDIWSLGMVFYFVLFGALPWVMTSKEKVFSHILHQAVIFPRKLSVRTETLIHRMLTIE